MLARLAGTATAPRSWWVPLVLLVLVTGLRRARLAHARGDTVTALTLVGLTANLVSPVSWTHHLVFLPVALILLAGSARPQRLVTAAICYALCVLSPIWWFDPGEAGAIAFLAANTFVLMTVVLVWTLPLRGSGGIVRPAGEMSRPSSPARYGSLR
jgi:hypothetical protein